MENLRTSILNSAVTLQCIFNKAWTTPDGGWNLTLSVNQDEAEKILQVSALRDMVLQVAIVPAELSLG